MDELDNDFKELCANLLSRVKKKAGDAEGRRKVQSRTRSTATKSQLKKSKSAAKSKSQPGSSVGKGVGWPGHTSHNGQALGHEPEGEATACGNAGPPLGDGNGDPSSVTQLHAMAPKCKQNSLAANDLRTCSQTASSFTAAAEPATSTSSPAKTLQISGTRLRVAELVLERMQQFKRVGPKQLKHTLGSNLPETVTDGNILNVNQENHQPGNVTLDLPANEPDVALSVALQQELKEVAPGSLEEAGLFFCQLCQKDLSAMNTTRREQHVNRCLDEMEKSQVPCSSNPLIPECPICGKQFHTPKSRASHLKRCAVKMEVPPQLLLQAVQSQALAVSEGPPVAPSNQLSRSKRKGSSKEKESKKKRKTSKVETTDEDLLVAMAMSRSLLEQTRQEQAKSVTSIKLESPLPIKWKPGAEKKRRKNALLPPPPLLLQDPETAQKQIQNRMAMLLTEEVAFPSTPPLPASRILEDNPGKTAWLLSLPKDQRSTLWECSTLTGPCVPESFYAVGLTPLILPWKPVQSHTSGTLLPSVGSDQSQLSQERQTSSDHPDPPSIGLGNRTSDDPQAGPDGEQQLLSGSQKDVQTLRDLVELAGEGLTLTQWNQDMDHTRGVTQWRGESVSSDIPLSGFVPPAKEKRCQGGSLDTSSLRSLAVDFSGMVNNPHLSDVQFQVDSGEVLYAHMFVLYARCPRLTEVVHNEGFLVEEDGDRQTRRVLLSEVTVEAAQAFLQYLYAAETTVPSQALSDVRALAIRFGVSELITVCRNSPGEKQEQAGVDSEDDLFSVEEEENCENRAENFQELLRSMWVDEDEEDVALLKPEDQEEDDNEKVAEQELDEIYEFVATQRKIVQGESEMEKGTGSSTDSETEEAQNLNQQTENEEAKVSESPSMRSKVKEWKENFDLGRSSCESPGQKKKIPGVNRSGTMSVTQITSVHLLDKPGESRDDVTSSGAASDEREASKRMSKVVTFSRSSQVSQGKEEDGVWEKLFLSCQQNGADLNKNCGHVVSTIQQEHNEPAPLNKDHRESGEITIETHIEVNNSPVRHQSQKDILSVRSELCSSSLMNPCSLVLPAVGSSPVSPESNRTFSRASTEISPVAASKRNKNKRLFQSDRESCQKANEQADASGLEKIRNVLSPTKSPHVDFKKQKHVPTCSSLGLTAQNAASHVNQEADVILLLDSDEEMELEQMQEKAGSDFSQREMEISRQLDVNCKNVEHEHEVPKSGPVSVADIEICQSPFQMSLGSQDEVPMENAAKLSGEGPLNNQGRTCIDSKLNLSHEESSSVDTSWLVPDTPLLTRSRNCSTQTQTTSLRSQGSQHRTKAFLVNNSDNKGAGETVKIPEITSDLLLVTSSQKPLHPGNSSGSKKSSPDSPLGCSWKASVQVSPVSPAPLSPACVRVKEKSSESLSSPKRGLPFRELPLENKTEVSVVEVEDSEEEKEVVPFHSSGSFLLGDGPPLPVDDECWSVKRLSPLRDNSEVFERLDYANTSSPIRGKRDSLQLQWKSPARALEMTGSTPLRGNAVDRRKPLFGHEETPVEAHPSVVSRPSFLNSKVWEEWDEDELPEVLPLTQRVSVAAAAQSIQPLKTPEPPYHKRNHPPKVPITPIPAYSIMETPELKKQLNRFGVRPLPKRQMVLKLKEIFQYTHQIVSSDSEDEIPSSQPPRRKASAKLPSQPQADLIERSEESAKAPRVGCKQKQGGSVPSLLVLGSGDADSSEGSTTAGYLRTKTRAETKGHPGGARGLKGATLSPATSPVKESLVGGADGQMLSASQESAASSVPGSDNSFGSQSSSSSEFETNALTSEEDEGIPASQAAAREADTLEAVRRYIHSNPALYRKILFYQPFELTGLQAELKQNGIKISLGKLLDFLDAHCITFTTAGARKEKQQQQGNKKKRCKRF